jgi:hypothetical protein
MSRGHSQRIRPNPKRTPSKSSHQGFVALQELLREFASALLPRGMTPKLFGELARSAFVDAAAEKSRLQNGRVNHSRVAAQTGLSRADVKRLLHLPAPERISDQSPVQRVLNGWRRDGLFTDRNGHAKRLTISGHRPTFKRLAEKYAGDVPYRAVLDELHDMGAVALTSRYVALRGSQVLRRRNDFSFLSPLAAPLKDGLGIVSATTKAGAFPLIQRLNLPAATDVDLSIVKARCIERVTSMLEGLGHSISDTVTLPTKRTNAAAYSFTVTVLLAENRAKKPSHPRNRRGERVSHGQ